MPENYQWTLQAGFSVIHLAMCHSAQIDEENENKRNQFVLT